MLVGFSQVFINQVKVLVKIGIMQTIRKLIEKAGTQLFSVMSFSK